jgi:SIR2-like domain
MSEKKKCRDDMLDALDVLEEAIQKGRPVVPLLGAGISVESGVPTTAEMVTHLAEILWLAEKYQVPPTTLLNRRDYRDFRGGFKEINDATIPHHTIQYNKNLVDAIGKVETCIDASNAKGDGIRRDVRELLSELEKAAWVDWRRLIRKVADNRPDRIDYVVDSLIRGRRPSTPHQFLAFLARVLGWRTILTTNFDTLIEQALREHGLEPVVYELIADSALPDPDLVRRNLSVIKLHGGAYSMRVDASLDLELSASDCRRVACYLPKQALLMVLGYGGGDRRVMSVLREFLYRDEDKQYSPKIIWAHRGAKLPRLPKELKERASKELASKVGGELAKKLIIPIRFRDAAHLLRGFYMRLETAFPASSSHYRALPPIPAPHLGFELARSKERCPLNLTKEIVCSAATTGGYDKDPDRQVIICADQAGSRDASNRLHQFACEQEADRRVIWCPMGEIANLHSFTALVLREARVHDPAVPSLLLSSSPDAGRPNPGDLENYVDEIVKALGRGKYLLAIDSVGEHGRGIFEHYLGEDPLGMGREDAGKRVQSAKVFLDLLIKRQDKLGRSMIAIAHTPPAQGWEVGAEGSGKQFGEQFQGKEGVRFHTVPLPEDIARTMFKHLKKLFIEGFDLRLMSSLNDVNGIPTQGKGLIIVAVVKNVLHFRIFDDDGRMVVDTDEQRLTKQARQIEDLRKQLEILWPSHKLTTSDKDQVTTAVTSIVDHIPIENIENVDYAKAALKFFESLKGFEGLQFKILLAIAASYRRPVPLTALRTLGAILFRKVEKNKGTDAIAKAEGVNEALKESLLEFDLLLDQGQDGGDLDEVHDGIDRLLEELHCAGLLMRKAGAFYWMDPQVRRELYKSLKDTVGLRRVANMHLSIGSHYYRYIYHASYDTTALVEYLYHRVASLRETESKDRFLRLQQLTATLHRDRDHLLAAHDPFEIFNVLEQLRQELARLGHKIGDELSQPSEQEDQRKFKEMAARELLNLGERSLTMGAELLRDAARYADSAAHYRARIDWLLYRIKIGSGAMPTPDEFRAGLEKLLKRGSLAGPRSSSDVLSQAERGGRLQESWKEALEYLQRRVGRAGQDLAIEVLLHCIEVIACATFSVDREWAKDQFQALSKAIEDLPSTFELDLEDLLSTEKWAIMKILLAFRRMECLVLGRDTKPGEDWAGQVIGLYRESQRELRKISGQTGLIYLNNMAYYVLNGYVNDYRASVDYLRSKPRFRSAYLFLDAARTSLYVHASGYRRAALGVHYLFLAECLISHVQAQSGANRPEAATSNTSKLDRARTELDFARDCLSEGKTYIWWWAKLFILTARWALEYYRNLDKRLSDGTARQSGAEAKSEELRFEAKNALESADKCLEYMSDSTLKLEIPQDLRDWLRSTG